MVLLIGMVVSAAQAATLFSDDFQDGNTSGWSKSGGEWSVVTDGSLALRQGKLDSELARLFAGNSGWTNYSVQARVKPLAFDGGARFAGLAARASGATTMYRLVLLNTNRAELQAVNGGAVTVLGGASRTVATGTWYTLRVEVTGTTIRGFVDGAQVASATSSAVATGRIGVLTFHATASFDDVLVSDGTSPPTSTGPTTTVGPTTTTRPSTTTTGPTTTTRPGQAPGLVGWATQNGGTSGGSASTVVTVSNAAALEDAVGSATSQTVRVSGMISVSGMIDVASNKTIQGVGSNSGITGGGFNLSGVRNVIIRNLVFRNADDDSINVQTSSTNIWIDHNDLANGFDGLIDVKRGSDFVTVSWNHLHDHSKSMLLGHDDGNASQDRGHLRVTYHHNWLDATNSRHPRVRFGNPVHVFNNYYNDIGDYGVASTLEGGVLVEGNSFENVDDPFHLGEGDSPPGSLVARNNLLVNSGAGQTGGSVASIPYGYSLDPAAGVKSIVTSGAGVGRIGL
jgi:pectate lyase